MMQTNVYNWEGVLEFLHKQHQAQAQNQNLWFLQKKGLNQQIKQLQNRVTALQNINNDLLDRNRMLQYCLRQLKSQKGQVAQVKQPNAPKIPQRRPKPNKNHVNRILQSLGIRNLIQNIQKDLQMREQSGLNIEGNQYSARQKQKEVVSAKSSVYEEIAVLTGHQDGVRDIHFCQNSELMISVSEDCTMKVWKMLQKTSQCLGTIREHSGPIFTVTEGDNHIFTGGMEGIVRCWNFKNVQNKKDINISNLIGQWNNSQQQKLQPIWQLLYSPEAKMLFSTSSESSIKAYKIHQQKQKVKGSFSKSYFHKQLGSFSREQEDIPTSICMHKGQLVSGYVNSHSLIHFDLETGKVMHELKFSANGQFSTNKVVSHPKLLMAAYEDKMVRLFDKNKMTYAFKAHEDSVMSIALTANINEFFTCGHDGFVKLWDIRKLDPISSFNAHAKKYDEAVHCISANKNYKAASGGADSIIKIYSANL